MEADPVYPSMYPPVEGKVQLVEPIAASEPVLTEMSKEEVKRIMDQGILASIELQNRFTRPAIPEPKENLESGGPNAPDLSAYDIAEILDVNDEKSNITLYPPTILARWFTALFARFSTGPKVKVVGFSSTRLSEFNPSELSQYAPGVKGLVGGRSNTEILKQAGINNNTADQLEALGLDIATFSKAHYQLSQMRQLFDSLDRFEAAGFRQHHLYNCNWRIAELASAYDTNFETLAKRYRMTPQELMRSGVTARLLIQCKTTLDQAIQGGKLYDLAYAMNLPVGEFCESFSATPADLFNKEDEITPNKLTQSQYRSLATCVKGWTIQDLTRAGLTQAEVVTLELGVTGIPQFGTSLVRVRVNAIKKK